MRQPRVVVDNCCGVPSILNTGPRNPGGCLMVQGALACGEAADSIPQELTACRAAGEAAIRRRLEQAKSNNQTVICRPIQI